MISIADFCDIFEYSRSAVDVSILNHRNGVNSKLAKYYVDGMMDDVKFRKDIETTNRVRNVAHTLYYPTVEVFGNEHRLAKFLAKITERSVATWANFLSKSLFQRPKSKDPIVEPSPMMVEFGIVSACLFVILTKDGTLNSKDWII